MKELQPDDARLTAYMLGELPPKEAKLIAGRLESHPELAIDMAKTQALGQLLCETYEKEGLSLHPVQRAVIQRVGRSQEAHNLRSVKRRWDWYRGVGISLAAAASIAIVLLILAKTPVKGRAEIVANDEELNMDVVLSPASLVQWGEAKFTGTAKGEPRELEQSSSEREKDVARQEFAKQIVSDPQRFFAAAELTARRQHLPEAESFVPLSENDYLSTRDQPLQEQW